MHMEHRLLTQPVPADSAVGRALRLCLDELDALAAEYVRDVRQLGGYPASAVSEADLLAAARGSVEFLLRTVGGLPLTDDLKTISLRIGRKRARQGIPIDSLLRAVRMDFRLVWNAMRRHVPDDSVLEFTEGVVPIWDAVEIHTLDVHSGYLAELAVLAREAEHERAFLLRRLLTAATPDAQITAQVARALHVQEDRHFLVAVAAPTMQPELRAAAGAASADHLVHDIDGETFAIIESGLDEEMPSWLRGSPVGVAPLARGLIEVPRAVRIARKLAAVIPGDAPFRAFTMHADWAPSVAADLGEFGRALSAVVLAPLDARPEAERALVIESLRSFLRTGSAARSAEELYCHRNTILNRLNRFTEITGYDVTHPAEAALIHLALECADPIRTPR
ncbi:helix-turn-helix domain-containing protein [Microbacterium sp. PMB16]|uniref:helix-turn-helix domain-containing protein n=1 Tax=Microbacterium sp. PMB16 TaxID=3120157 RepID=UPI003F4B5F0F